MPRKANRRLRLFLLLAYVSLACFFVFIFKPVYLLSIIIVLVPPALVNFFWLKHSRAKILIFSLLSALLFAPAVEIMARLTNAWDVQSVLPRLFGVAPLENILFAFLNFFWVLSFYEYFIDHDNGGRISRRIHYLVLAYCLLTTLVFTLFFVNANWIAFNYHTLSLMILLVPGIIIFTHRPKLLIKTWLPTLFLPSSSLFMNMFRSPSVVGGGRANIY